MKTIFNQKYLFKKTNNNFIKRFFKRIYSCFFILLGKDCYLLHCNTHNKKWYGANEMEFKVKIICKK